MALNFTQQLLLKTLLQIKQLNEPNPSFGMCWHVNTMTEDPSCVYYFTQLIRGWPKHSGDKYYPVPATTAPNAGTQYLRTRDITGLWNKETEYGKLRYELLDWCIEQLNQEKYNHGIQATH